jgi:hypothetical protein
MKPTALLLAAALLPSCSSTKGESYTKAGFDPNSIMRTAVVDGNNPTYKIETRQTLVDTVQMEFLKRGWPVVERSNIQKALDEVKFQNGEITSPADRQKVGEILNVDALTFVNIGGTNEDMSVTIKMIDVETGEVLWMGTGEGSLNSTMSVLGGAVLGAAAGAVVGNQIGSGHGGTGAAIGGVLGGAAGYGLTPSALENAKDLVKTICTDVPKRG